MEYSVSQVAAMSGLSARTLRHYDDIGLLTPARTAVNGYRWYGRAELIRLQRILLLRRLRMPLPAIDATLADEARAAAELRDHRARIAADRAELDEILGVIDRTVNRLSADELDQNDEFLADLALGRHGLQEDLRQRYGRGVDAHFETAAAVTAEWAKDDYDQAAEQHRDLLGRMAALLHEGIHPGDDRALDLVDEHYRAIRALWPADATAYRELGRLIVENADQRAMVAAVDPQLPPWLRAAIETYATQRL
ncbi:MerR family transcriptional regulator [Kribbella sp. DT2]|uniref:MerR family transcriptional regulator n=1 Tax=Kribbella sp. DT2 TaxID=3393427 RepID=UPI003CF2AB3F